MDVPMTAKERAQEVLSHVSVLKTSRRISIGQVREAYNAEAFVEAEIKELALALLKAVRDAMVVESIPGEDPDYMNFVATICVVPDLQVFAMLTLDSFEALEKQLSEKSSDDS